MSIRDKMRITISVWGSSFRIFKRYPRIFFPLGAVAFLEFTILTLLFLAPFYPISVVLAPPIRKFWGEIYLHYPVNFLLLPKLFKYCSIISGVIVESMMIGVIVGMISQANKGIRPGLRSNLKKSMKKYLTLVGVWLLSLVSITIVFKGSKFLAAKYQFNNIGFLNRENILYIALGVSLLIGIMIEAMLAYAIPSTIIENKTIWKAVGRSFSMAKDMFLPTFILILVPTFLSFMVEILKWNIAKLMDNFFPEVTLYIMGLEIIISLFANCLLITSVTTLFLRKIKREH